MNICEMLISIKPTAEAFICMQHPGTIAGTNTGGREKRDGMLRGWRQRYQKIFSLNRPSLNNPLIIWCFSVCHQTSDCHEMQSGPHQRQLSERKWRSEVGGSMRGLRWMLRQTPHCGKPENNLWRQVGAMYGVQKNNCYPFKSNF